MYQIFLTNLLIDKDKEIVRKYNQYFDAQSIWKEYSDHCMKSTAAQINTSDLLTYITSVCIDDGSWRGSTGAFIIHWMEQVCRYEEHIPTLN